MFVDGLKEGFIQLRKDLLEDLIQQHEERKAGRMITTDSNERKEAPVFSGVMAYFPLALIEVARLSKIGNDKHNPGEVLHWARGKSTDHADCIARHLLEHGTLDEDGVSHTAKVAWRALALLQEEMEQRAV